MKKCGNAALVCSNGKRMSGTSLSLGSLLARITPQSIELMTCRKCERLQMIPNSRISWVLTTDPSESCVS